MKAIRYALRQLLRRPGFSTVVIMMLAVGIGATTAMFSMFHQVLLGNRSVDEPDRLVNLGAPGPKRGSDLHDGAATASRCSATRCSAISRRGKRC